MNHPITAWLGVIFTLAVLSYLVKDNALYRLAQKAAMGIGVGILVVQTWQQVLDPYWWTPIKTALAGGPASGLFWLLALIPGGLWYCQMSRKWFWVSQPVLGLFIGVAAGITFKTQVLLILPQIGATLRPLNPWALPGGLPWDHFWENGNLWTVLDNAVFLLAFFTALFYFLFTIKADNRVTAGSRRFGRMMIMVALGAMFGNTAMTRMSFLIERMQFLFDFFARLFQAK